MCLGPSDDPMWEDSRSIYVEITAASPFKYFITRFPRESPWSHEVRTTVASRFKVLNGNTENEEMLRAVVAFEGAHIADCVKVVSTGQGRLTINGLAFARKIAGTSSCSNSPSTG